MERQKVDYEMDLCGIPLRIEVYGNGIRLKTGEQELAIVRGAQVVTLADFRPKAIDHSKKPLTLEDVKHWHDCFGDFDITKCNHDDDDDENF